jgi:hypothetical protein
VDRLVAGLADLDPFAHLLARVPLPEPLVAVQGPGDEVVEVVGLLALAEFAQHLGPIWEHQVEQDLPRCIEKIVANIHQ